jgi:hypothetical protein
LVVGSGAFTTTAQSSADAYNKNDHNGNNADDDGGGGGGDNSQEGTRMTGKPVSGECEACFDPLTTDQKSGFEDLLPNHFSGVTTKLIYDANLLG